MANESGITRESSDYNKTGWIVAFTAVAVATIVGNSLTLAVFHRTKMFHRRSSYLLINLTVADGLVGVLSIPLFIYILCVRDVGSVLSNVYTFQDIFLGLTSVTSLMFISAERFYAVRYPLKYRSLSTRPHVIMILLSWTFAGFIASARILTTLGLLDTMTLTYLMGNMNIKEDFSQIKTDLKGKFHYVIIINYCSFVLANCKGAKGL
ncbi:predicted protein [Nematostella vectensis]|uniref:G-protein coupled receptors family 1 profile domain-containing protein n=1 Tax=Nematostella vectensis TaxID=45351 RepID=A7S2J8_NEMVE|nr:predicted protein [Nematostella vectensis]|eukprot:XP_001634118.1 predicted protein [Nematostella vectensis]